MKTEEILKTADENLIPAYNRFPIVIDHGDGCYVYDVDGKKYLDFVGGISVNALGYNDEGIKKTVEDQISKLQHISNLYYTEPLISAAGTLSKAVGKDKVFFTNSGAEAVEGALKLARRHQSLNKGEEAVDIITMNGSFHGRTFAAVTVTGKPEYHEHFGPMLPKVKYAEYNDIDSVRELLGDESCAVIVEPIKGEGGIIPAEAEFLQELRALCDETDTLLIFDEVQCGAGRTGTFTAAELYGVEPDIIAVAKGIGAGFPVGAFLADAEIAESMSAGTHGTTYGGNPLACSVVDYVVSKTSKPEFLDAVKSRGEHLNEKLKELSDEFEVITDVRGTGLLQGIELSIPVSDVVNAAMEEGLLLVSAANNTIRIVPPLIITEAEIDEGIEILRKVLKKVTNN